MFTTIAMIAFDAIIKKKLRPSVMLGWGIFFVSALIASYGAYMIISGMYAEMNNNIIVALTIFDGYLAIASIVGLAIAGVVVSMKKVLKKADEEYLDSR